jgi:hypothetical protein
VLLYKASKQGTYFFYIIRHIYVLSFTTTNPKASFIKVPNIIPINVICLKVLNVLKEPDTYNIRILGYFALYFE